MITMGRQTSKWNGLVPSSKGTGIKAQNKKRIRDNS
jgi:hypothetical protein